MMAVKKRLICFFLLVISFGANACVTGTIVFDFDMAATTSLLRPPYISGVIDDPTDPAAIKGIIIDVKENGKLLLPDNYTVTALSDNNLIVHDKNIIISKSSGIVTVKIIPSGVGYSNITLTLTHNKETKSLTIFYASSAASDIPGATFWHAGVSDASAVVALDSDYMVIADDEINALLVFNRYQSGLPVASFSYGNFSRLTDGSDGNYKEVDCEAGTRSLIHPQKTYWSGSMSNGGKHMEEKPNRSCLFETIISGTGANTKFAFKGHYNDLRKQIIKWGDKNGYKLSAAAAYGMTPKSTEGFNIEGMVFGPDSTTMYICFRAPIVPATKRTNALIAPILNFENWFNDGNISGTPAFGDPIELDLGGRGIRDMLRLSNGTYLIVAGSSDEILNGALYSWTGKPFDTPILANTIDVYALKMESAIEVITSGHPTGKVQVISDNGSNVFYNDDQQTKFLAPAFRKFRSDIIDISQSK